MAAHAAIDGAGEAIAAGAVDGELAEKEQQRKAQGADELADRAHAQGRHGKSEIERHKQRNRDQEPDQELIGRAGLF